MDAALIYAWSFYIVKTPKLKNCMEAIFKQGRVRPFFCHNLTHWNFLRVELQKSFFWGVNKSTQSLFLHTTDIQKQARKTHLCLYQQTLKGRKGEPTKAPEGCR